LGARWRRMLNVEMNSKACGESPSMFLRCSAATSLGRVSVYVMICFKLSSSSGSSCCKRGTAQDSSVEAMVSRDKRRSCASCFGQMSAELQEVEYFLVWTHSPCSNRHTTTFPLTMTLSRRPARVRPTPRRRRDGVARRAASQVRDHVACRSVQRDVRKRERSGASIIVYLNFELVAVQDGVVACCRNLERTIG